MSAILGSASCLAGNSVSGYADYRLFGGVLRSDLEFPELEPVQTDTPSWTLHSVFSPPPGEAGEYLGSDHVIGNVQVKLYRQALGLRMVFDDTGGFDISADGRTLTWYRPTDSSLTDARADLTSRVLAAALHLAGTLSLHGSAVVLKDQAIGFIAPKLHGKSTLALALVAAGARLLTDDTLPVETGAVPRARPGLHATRLWPDSAARVGLGEAQPAKADEKQLFGALPAEYVTHESCPLSALYLLAPTQQKHGQEAVWRTRLSSIEAALAVVGHAKLSPLLGKSESPVLLQRAVRLSQQVAIYRLHIVRDLERLDDVVTTLCSWHLQSGPAGTSSGQYHD